jgi:hypothetical protein
LRCYQAYKIEQQEQDTSKQASEDWMGNTKEVMEI